jgi:hypothetical protein
VRATLNRPLRIVRMSIRRATGLPGGPETPHPRGGVRPNTGPVFLEYKPTRTPSRSFCAWSLSAGARQISVREHPVDHRPLMDVRHRRRFTRHVLPTAPRSPRRHPRAGWRRRANHRDPVMASHLPAGEPGSEVKASTRPRGRRRESRETVTAPASGTNTATVLSDYALVPRSSQSIRCDPGLGSPVHPRA